MNLRQIRKKIIEDKIILLKIDLYEAVQAESDNIDEIAKKLIYWQEMLKEYE